MIQSCGNPQERKKFYVLQSCGQLIKTRFIRRCLQSQPLRQRIHARLNKGEELMQMLRAWL
jgi:TnpA family transposase